MLGRRKAGSCYFTCVEVESEGRLWLKTLVGGCDAKKCFFKALD